MKHYLIHNVWREIAEIINVGASSENFRSRLALFLPELDLLDLQTLISLKMFTLTHFIDSLFLSWPPFQMNRLVVDHHE